MPTARIYYDDAFTRKFTAQVVSCEPAGAPGDGSPVQKQWRVKLDRTAFYPTSGGQPHDLGRLGDVNVVDVIDEDDEIIHVVDRAIEAGTVKASIDWARRFDHMQQHSGQHLLSAVFHAKFALPTVSFHLGSDICTIDLRGREPTLEILESAACAANEIVYQDRAVNVKYGTAEELAAAGVRKTVERAGVLRAIAIEDLELQPCGGTHVRRTGQIGMIHIRGISRIRQDWRVEFVCGKRAEQVAREDLAALKAVAQRLNCSVAEAVATAERVVAERDAHFKSARASMEKLAGLDARSAVQTCEVGANGLRVIARVFSGVAPEYVQAFAREAAKADRSVVLAVRSECGHVFFSQHPSAGKDMNILLAEALKHVEGKGGGSRDSARGRVADPKRGRELLNAAVSELEYHRS
ncbi:MAG: alanyl-tRNA editing protein [Acidobacteriota bacterium]|nr:alanyl-tRNA editing protein [Acidobacteriota bacterium]